MSGSGLAAHGFRMNGGELCRFSCRQSLIDDNAITRGLRDRDRHHEICFVTRAGAPVAGPTYPIAVAGPLCEAGDVFTQQDGGFIEFRDLPLPKPGDIAILRDAGAYGATMSSNYNTRPLAPEVMLDAGALSAIRKRQSIEQLLDLESDGGPL
jgi:diaminopimelate decarboxylase